MRRFALILAILTGATAGHAGEMLDEEGILAALMDRKVLYESGARQDFRPSMRTLYTSGRPSWGYWAVRGDQYCSMWPPSDIWACYDMERLENGIRFIGSSGDITNGTYTN
jgi:hypothetical protein